MTFEGQTKIDINFHQKRAGSVSLQLIFVNWPLSQKLFVTTTWQTPEYLNSNVLKVFFLQPV